MSVVRLLLDARADVNHAISETSLSQAAFEGKLEIMKELLKNEANIEGTSVRRNALARACDGNQYAAVVLLFETLFDSQVKADICGDAFSTAIKARDAKIVRLLLKHEIPASLELARQDCAAGALKAVKLLVSAEIDINDDDGTDEPLLHVAACHSQPAIVQFLIDCGADVDSQSHKYGSLIISTLKGYHVAFLRASSQSEFCRSHAKKLPLSGPLEEHLVYGLTDCWRKSGREEIKRCEQITQSLLDAGAKVDITIRIFGNSLHLASYMGFEFIVSQLLRKITDVNVFGGYFETSLIAALKGEHSTIVNLFIKR